MKKRFFVLIPILALILVCIPMAFQVNAATDNNIDITVSFHESVKIGQSCRNVQPEISIAGTIDGYDLRVGNGEYAPKMSIYGKYITEYNRGDVSFYLFVDISEEDKFYGFGYNTDFTINGQDISYPNVRQSETDFGFCYYFTADINIDLSDRTIYTLSYSDEYISPNCSFYLPSVAEAGAKIPFDGFGIYTDSEAYEIIGYTANETEISSGEYFVMPSENVKIGVIVNDLYKGWEYIHEVNVSLDFDDDDIFYGRILPTEDDFFNALSVSCDISGSPISIKDAWIDTIYDESRGGDRPWVGNQFLSFQVEAAEGYLFENPYLDMSELGANWYDENLTVKVNGVESYYRRGVYDNYADGYFVSGYYCSPTSIEIHISWYGTRTLKDFDLSGYSAGDIVTIPDSVFEYDGYIPERYTLKYYTSELGYVGDEVFGKTFVMPEAEGEVTVEVHFLRGQKKSVYVLQSEDSEDLISLDVKEGTFPDVTILQVAKIQRGNYDDYWVLDLVERTLSEIANDYVPFKFLAHSHNRYTQPEKNIIVTFPIPEGFDSNYIAFCNVTDNGTYEIVPTEIDREKGICRAVISHFSIYVIVSLKEESNLPTHIIHDLVIVPEKQADCKENGHSAYYTCSGCDKWFADENSETEITDKNSIFVGYESGEHTGGVATCSKKAVCTVCEQEYGEYNAENHVDTKVVNAKAENCGENGYTGDTYCNDCEKTISTGTTIVATGEHTYNNGICSVCNGADPNYTPDSPETGDNRMAHLWFVLLTVSVLGIVAVTIKSKSYR